MSVYELHVRLRETPVSMIQETEKKPPMCLRSLPMAARRLFVAHVQQLSTMDGYRPGIPKAIISYFMQEENSIRDAGCRRNSRIARGILSSGRFVDSATCKFPKVLVPSSFSARLYFSASTRVHPPKT